jgi:nickel/cobalt exporter
MLSPAARADTVASLLGNFTINQYCGLKLSSGSIALHYVVVYGQLPALRELHEADSDGNGVTSQQERDDYIGKLAPRMADQLLLEVGGVQVPFRATGWSTSLPNEQGGFSLRVDVDLIAALPAAARVQQSLRFTNQNYSGRLGWHEIVVETAPGVAVFDSNAYGNSLTGALRDALQSLPAEGPLDERMIQLSYTSGYLPPGANLLAARTGVSARPGAPSVNDSAWIAQKTRRLIDSISGPSVAPSVAILTLLGALLLGAVHAFSPGHGKTVVGAYLIGSRGTPRHAAFLGLTVTITHTVGVFVLGFATLYASRFIEPERLFPILSVISALLVLGMGIVLLAQRCVPARQVFLPVIPGSATQGLVLMHSHGGGPMHSHLPPGTSGEKITWRSLLTLGISGGLVPCPSAMVLLLGAVALNKTAYGMLLVVAFSIGLAITLTAVGMAFLYARNRFRRRPSASSRWLQWLPVMSAATIAAIGLGLCVAALKSFGS